MQTLVVVLRLIHITTGVFWAGTLLFTAFLLTPAIGDTGPDGAKVMGALTKRGFLTLMPVVALCTLISGTWLMWITSAHFNAAWMGSTMGIALSTGGSLAIAAFVIGIAVMRPAALKAGGLAMKLPAMADGPEKQAAMAELMRLRQRGATAAKVVALILLAAVSLMAVARVL